MDTGEHGGTTCQHHIQVRSSYGDVCGVVMCVECGCAVSIYCKPCYALNTDHIVWTNTVLVVLYGYTTP